MRCGDTQMVQKTDCIVCHVAQQIGSGVAPAQQYVRRPRHSRRVELGGAANVAIVEANYPKLLLGEHLAKALVPAEHLNAEAHDQQERLGVGWAHLLVTDLDPVGGRQAFFTESGHPVSLTGPNPG